MGTTMTKLRLFLLLALVLVAAACRPTDVPPPASSATTPVAALPVNTSFRAQTDLPTPVAPELISAADAEYLLLTNLYERLSPSVVNIDVIEPSPHEGVTSHARASGFVYDSDGHIVTNAHVVNGALGVSVTFNDGYVAEAQVIGSDLFSDLAVIRVDVKPERLLPLVLGDSDTIRVGQRAIAIGNPFGLASSMTVGVISGLGRQLPSAELISNDITPGFQNPSIIQVDADINPGNSGGPLFNSAGEVIGVNTAIRTESGVFEGVGFSVPVNTLKRVAPEIIANGAVNYAWLGITSMSADDGLGVAALAEPLKLSVTQGVLIDTVAAESPASKAGLRGGNTLQTVRDQTLCAGGDIIVAVNGVFIANMDELMSYLVLNAHPGDTLTLLVVRGEDTFEIPVLMEARPTQGAVIPDTCGG